jgi:hypothetical protein
LHYAHIRGLWRCKCIGLWTIVWNLTPGVLCKTRSLSPRFYSRQYSNKELSFPA